MTKIANVKPSPRSQMVNFGDRNDAEITYASEYRIVLPVQLTWPDMKQGQRQLDVEIPGLIGKIMVMAEMGAQYGFQ